MKVITRNGKTLPVDISTLDEDEIRFLKAAEHVTMIDDGCYLKKMWRVTAEKDTNLTTLQCCCMDAVARTV